ncbi:sigma-54 interaction domain-containing protein [Symbiobacterium terraclitae]|uniref:sigma-54 interaction domain-containing protein n=1 Tax=Symbiobacterium terraclitae TaxID=557451 RepID=UPI0035B51BFD
MIDQTRLLKALMSVIDEGIHVIDSDGVTVLYNEQAGRNDGLTPEEVIGRHLLDLFPSLTPETSTLLKVLATGQPVPPREQTFANYKGQRVTTINSTLPIFHEGRLVGAIEVSKDVTRVRELSERVAGLQAELLGCRRRRGAPLGGARYTIDDLVGEHPAMTAVKERALKAARTDSPVLVYGETGTGKELLVHAIHAASPRRSRPLVAQNCAALPEGLLESLLFGTARGSFTGAEDRPGLFELADGGTLYLDEINSMQPDLQAKLLRVLQDGRIRRLGDAAERQVDVRVIASTNEEPWAAVSAGRLRRDLYYRINVVTLELPPLRERRSDIPLLTEHFLAQHSARLGAQRRPLSPEVERLFQIHTWPGNVRELEHALEAALQLAGGPEITLIDLPAHLQRAAAEHGLTGQAPSHPPDRPGVIPLRPDRVDPAQLRRSLAHLERAAVQQALEEADWNLSRAARILGLPRQTLQYRIKVLGLQRPDR